MSTSLPADMHMHGDFFRAYGLAQQRHSARDPRILRTMLALELYSQLFLTIIALLSGTIVSPMLGN